MVKEVEGKTHSIAECWKWQKGLLVDFISLKKENSKIESLLEKQNKLIKTMRVAEEDKTQFQTNSVGFQTYENTM